MKLSTERANRDGDAHPPTPDREIDIAKFCVTRSGEALNDARRFFTDATGKFAPTRKGFAISLRKLPELQKALAKAEREARTQGLLDDGDQKNGSRWAQLPSKPMVKDGELIRGPDGRIKYARNMEFETAEVRQAFNAAVLDAYDNYRPP